MPEVIAKLNLKEHDYIGKENSTSNTYSGERAQLKDVHKVDQKLPDHIPWITCAGKFANFVAVTPKIIHAHRAFNRAVEILRHNQAVEGMRVTGWAVATNKAAPNVM